MYLGSVKFYKHLIYGIGVLLICVTVAAVIWGMVSVPNPGSAANITVQSEQGQA